jgi:predicted NAD/FAD-binding protein
MLRRRGAGLPQRPGLALLADASADERAVLGAIRYHRNRALLHTDARVLPRRTLAWAAWNYERSADHQREQAAVCLHYLINRLQPLPWQQPVVVSLNPSRPIDPAQVIGEYDYSHPVFDAAAIAAQQPAAAASRAVRTCGSPAPGHATASTRTA